MKMKYFLRLALFAMIGTFIWTCNLSDSSPPDTLTFHLNDSLKTSAGKYDSIHIDFFTVSGSDTVFQKTIFHGIYSDSAQLKDLSLGENVSGNFVIRVEGYKDKQVILDMGVPFVEGHAAPKPIIYKNVVPGISTHHAPAFVSGLENVSMAEGETKRITVKAAAEDGNPIRFSVQNLDSLRSLFADGAKVIELSAAGDSLMLTFSPGSAMGNYRFRIALLDSTGVVEVQVLTISVGPVNRPPSIALVAPNSGPNFDLKEGETLSLRIASSDPDTGDIVTLLSLANPPWSHCGTGRFDTATGLLTYTPSFQCIASGESTFADLVFRAKDNGSPPETGQLSVRITVIDSNSAPRWKSGSISVSAKEGAKVSQAFADIYLGDAENDSVGMTVTCGTLDRASLIWSFTPGFRDAGQKDCDVIASDSHIPPASSKLTLKLSIADSVRKVDVAILSPAAGFTTKDSLVVVQWKVGDQAQLKDTTEKLKVEGLNVIRRAFTDSSGNLGTDSVNVYLDTKPPLAPVVSSNFSSPTNNPQPTWNWKSGGNGGRGVYRYKLGNENFSSGAFQGKDSSYKPSSPLGEGLQILYVQEQDSVGNWSSSGSRQIMVDITGPNAPLVQVSSGALSNNRTPVFSWSSGGKGDRGWFRFKLDDSILTVGAQSGGDSLYKPAAPGLVEGVHTFFVQEQDSAGNWSPIASKIIQIDLTPPNAPIVSAPTVHTINPRPTWSWTNGGNGGSGIFRYELDDSNMQIGGSLTSEMSFTPTADLSIASRHTLYVQERDSAGNWSALGSLRIHIHGQVGYAVGGSGTIIKSKDGGLTWDSISVSVTSGDLNSVCFPSSTVGFASGDGGILLKTNDAGASWSVLNSGTHEDLQSVYFADAGNGHAVGSHGLNLRTNDGGVTWIPQLGIDTSEFFYSTYFPEVKIGFAAGRNGRIVKTIDGGQSWAIQNSGTAQFLFSIYFVNSNIGYAVGYAGTIVKTVDGGSHWAKKITSFTQNLIFAYFVNSDIGFIAGDGGSVFKTLDGGEHWFEQAGLSFSSIYFSDLNTGYAVGGSGSIYKTSDSGATWLHIMNFSRQKDYGGFSSGFEPALNSVTFP